MSFSCLPASLKKGNYSGLEQGIAPTYEYFRVIERNTIFQK